MTKQLSRRLMLRGLGASLALPWLEAMQPRAFAQSTPPPLRVAFLYVPMGVRMEAWTPKKEGADFDLPPTLEPLKNVKNDLLVLTGLDHRRDDIAGNSHPRGSGTWLSTAPVGKTDTLGFCTDISVDQLAARHAEKETRLSSLELAGVRGTSKHACNISWRGPGAAMGTEVNPRQVFLRLFGDPKGDSVRRSILDVVLQNARQVRSELGRSDQGKLDEYLDSVRSIERQLQAIDRDKQKGTLPKVEFPNEVPADFPSRLRLLSNLLVLALQTDTTRVVSFLYANETGGMAASYRHLGFGEDHHSLTHWDKAVEEESIRRIRLIDHFHVQELAYMLEKMKSIQEGERTLLDNSIVVYGSGIQWGHKHDWGNVPTLLAGKGGGTIRTGRHLRLADSEEAGPGGVKQKRGIPLANLWLSVLDRAGVKLDRIADSTGRVTALSG